MTKQFQKAAMLLTAATLVFSLTGCQYFSDQEAESSKSAEEFEELSKQVKKLNDKLEDLEDENEDLKKQIEEEDSELEDDSKEKNSESTKTETSKTSEETQVEPAKTTPKKTTPAYTGPSYLRITAPEDKTYHHEAPVRFTGQTSPNTIKITVKATTPNSPNVDDYTLQSYNPRSTTFTYGASEEWNNLTAGTNTYIFTSHYDDGTTKAISHTIYYVPGGAEMGKPVIYLYPEEETEVFVNVEPTDGITVSDPELNGGWNVIATPEGEIINQADGKTYPYLFWEGHAANFQTPEEGFVVAQSEVANFFDEKLSYQGLNEKEIADFKEFWVPLMQEKTYYFITFIDQDTFEKYAPLTVNPKPDTTIRIFFDYKGLDEKITVPAQELKKGIREGFTLTEWGGRLYR